MVFMGVAPGGQRRRRRRSSSTVAAEIPLQDCEKTRGMLISRLRYHEEGRIF